MFCPNCGNKITDDAAFCPVCGVKVSEELVGQDKQQYVESDESTVTPPMTNQVLKNNNKKQGRKTKPIIVIISVIILMGLFGSLLGDSGDDTSKDAKVSNNKSARSDDKSGNKEKEDSVPVVEGTVEKLMKFTSLNWEDNENFEIFDFVHKNKDGETDWLVRVTEDNNMLRVYDYDIAKIFIDYVEDAFTGEYEFIYDFDENRVSVYLDEDIYGASTVSYYFSKDKIQLLAEGGRYSASDDFEEYLRDSGVFDMMKSDVEKIRSQLKDYSIEFEDVDEMEVEDVKAVWNSLSQKEKDDMIKSSKETKNSKAPETKENVTKEDENKIEGDYYEVGETASLSDGEGTSLDLIITGWEPYEYNKGFSEDSYETLMRVTASIQNTGNESFYVRAGDFIVYANNKSVESAIGINNEEDEEYLSGGTVSPGRKIDIVAYYELNPFEASTIELEFGHNLFVLKDANHGLETKMDYGAAYGMIISGISANYGSGNYYALYDIDNDGTKELLLSYGSTSADWTTEIFEPSYSDGSMDFTANILGDAIYGECLFYEAEDGNGIISVYGKQGYQTVSQITKDGSTLNTKVIMEGEAEGDEYYSNEHPIQMFSVDDSSGLK